MNTRHLTSIIFMITVSLIVSSCGPKPIVVPTDTSARTRTPIPEPTSTPTPDPIILVMEEASELWLSGDAAGAIAKYSAILEQPVESSTRTAVFAKLDEIGAEILQKANLQRQASGSHEDGIEACKTYKLARSAYLPLLNDKEQPASERSSFLQTPFFVNAATIDAALIDCYLSYDEPHQSYTNVINSFLDNLALYPDKSATNAILIPAIVETYKNMAEDLLFARSDITREEVINASQTLTQRVGDYKIKSEKVADIISMALAEAALCSEKPFDVPDLAIGTSATKKVETCPFFGDNSDIDHAGLRAANPSEIWFVLEYKSKDSPDLQCTGYRTDTATHFTYSYPGISSDIYSLKNVHTGRVVSSKTFPGTAPKCVFTECQLNTSTNTATCWGGAGSSTYDANVFTQWLKGFLK